MKNEIEILNASCTFDRNNKLSGFTGSVKINDVRHDGEFEIKEEYNGELVDFEPFLNEYFESHSRAN